MTGRKRYQVLHTLTCVLLIAAGVKLESAALAHGAETSTRVETVASPTSPPPGIAAEDVPKAKELAMSGSIDSAVKIARFYGERGNLKGKIFWLSVAVENGGDEQRLPLARALWLDENDPLNVTRARYWYNRIIKTSSSEMSAFAKTELDAKESYRRKFFPKTPKD